MVYLIKELDQVLVQVGWQCRGPGDSYPPALCVWGLGPGWLPNSMRSTCFQTNMYVCNELHTGTSSCSYCKNCILCLFLLTHQLCAFVLAMGRVAVFCTAKLGGLILVILETFSVEMVLLKYLGISLLNTCLIF
jgi:hypothetical protein